MRSRGAGPHQGGEAVVLIGVMGAAGPPVGRVRIVGDDPGTAGVHALGDHAKAGDEIGAGKQPIPHDLQDLGAQPVGVELRLEQRNAPSGRLKGARRQPEIEFLDLLCAKPERERAGDQGAGRGAADEVEPVAQPDLAGQAFRKNGLDALQKRDRDRAAHAAAVEGENSFRTRTEQVPVAGAVERGRFCHRDVPQLEFDTRLRWI